MVSTGSYKCPSSDSHANRATTSRTRTWGTRRTQKIGAVNSPSIRSFVSLYSPNCNSSRLQSSHPSRSPPARNPTIRQIETNRSRRPQSSCRSCPRHRQEWSSPRRHRSLLNPRSARCPRILRSPRQAEREVRR